MFDSFYDGDGHEWQTKALSCLLDAYRIGAPIPGPPNYTYQMKVLGGPSDARGVYSYATIRGGVLTAIPDERDERLALLDYHGGWLSLEEADRG